MPRKRKKLEQKPYGVCSMERYHSFRSGIFRIHYITFARRAGTKITLNQVLEILHLVEIFRAYVEEVGLVSAFQTRFTVMVKTLDI